MSSNLFNPAEYFNLAGGLAVGQAINNPPLVGFLVDDGMRPGGLGCKYNTQSSGEDLALLLQYFTEYQNNLDAGIEERPEKPEGCTEQELHRIYDVFEKDVMQILAGPIAERFRREQDGECMEDRDDVMDLLIADLKQYGYEMAYFDGSAVPHEEARQTLRNGIKQCQGDNAYELHKIPSWNEWYPKLIEVLEKAFPIPDLFAISALVEKTYEAVRDHWSEIENYAAELMQQESYLHNTPDHIDRQPLQ